MSKDEHKENPHDIIAEIRKAVDYGDGVLLNLPGRDLLKFLDRLETALKSEYDITVMLAALKKARMYVNAAVPVPRIEVLDAIDYALFKSARNCDVGSPVGQTQRFRRFCAEQGLPGRYGCFGCQFQKSKAKCEFLWAQMTYKKEGVK